MIGGMAISRRESGETVAASVSVLSGYTECGAGTGLVGAGWRLGSLFV
jgi:hypothetical protein